MKRHLLYIFAAAAICPALTGCSDDDTLLPLDAPEVTNPAASVSSLTFAWDAVEGATQYALELYAPDGNKIKTLVTTATEATFSKLSPSTTYTLKVWAYGPLYGDKTTSPTFVLTATTPAITTLATPQPTAVDNGPTVTVSWDAIANAQYYEYAYIVSGESKTGTTEQTSINLAGLPTGTYTVTVKAVNDDEAFVSSAAGSVTFTRSRYQLWECEGVYYSAYYKDYWDTKIIAYSDGSYVIPAWYQYDGYDLVFSYDAAAGQLVILNPDAWINEYGYTCVPTGITGYDLPLWLDGGFSGMKGGQTAGSMWVYDGWCDYDDPDCYDTFYWEKQMTVDDVAGTYECYMSGYTLTNDWKNWDWFEYTYNLEITKVDATTVQITDLYWDGLPLTGTFDPKTQKITFRPQAWGYYTFCLDTEDGDIPAGTEQPVVATVNDNMVITMDNWTAAYAGMGYFCDVTTRFTKL